MNRQKMSPEMKAGYERGYARVVTLVEEAHKKSLDPSTIMRANEARFDAECRRLMCMPICRTIH